MGEDFVFVGVGGDEVLEVVYFFLFDVVDVFEVLFDVVGVLW